MPVTLPEQGKNPKVSIVYISTNARGSTTPMGSHVQTTMNAIVIPSRWDEKRTVPVDLPFSFMSGRSIL